jgi:amidase
VMGSLSGLRIGYSADLGGAFRVDPQVAAVLEEAGRLLVRSGASVYAAHPDLSLAEDTFRTLRAWHFQASYGDLLREHPDEIKQSLADNIRAGEDLSGADVARAYTQRSSLSGEMHRFFQDYDLLVLPTSQVPPFPIDQEYPTEIDGERMETYLDWMRSAYLITVTGCPAISLPAGHTPDGLPVGVQLVAPHGQDRRLLEIAAAYEIARGW